MVCHLAIVFPKDELPLGPKLSGEVKPVMFPKRILGFEITAAGNSQSYGRQSRHELQAGQV